MSEETKTEPTIPEAPQPPANLEPASPVFRPGITYLEWVAAHAALTAEKAGEPPEIVEAVQLFCGHCGSAFPDTCHPGGQKVQKFEGPNPCDLHCGEVHEDGRVCPRV